MNKSAPSLSKNRDPSTDCSAPAEKEDEVDPDSHQLGAPNHIEDEIDPGLDRLCGPVEMEDETEADSRRPNDRVTPAPWSALFAFTAMKHIPLFLVATGITCGAAALLPIQAAIVGRTFQQFASFGSQKIDGTEFLHKIKNQAYRLIILGFIEIALNSFFYMAWTRIGDYHTRTINKRLFAALVEQDMAWFSSHQTGISAYIPRLRSQVRDVEKGISLTMGFAIYAAVSSIASLGLALHASWKLTLVTISLLPLLMGAISCVNHKVQTAVMLHSQRLTPMSKIVTAVVSGISTIKLYNGQQWEAQRYEAATEAAASIYLRSASWNALRQGGLAGFAIAIFITAFWYGSYLVNSKQADVSQVMTSFVSVLFAMGNAQAILPQLIFLDKARAAGATLVALLQELNEKSEEKTHTELFSANCTYYVHFSNLSFAYPSNPRTLVLDTVNLVFSPDRINFVIGKSGSGKSSFAQLLLRLYEPSSGAILLKRKDHWERNGMQELAKHDKAWVRRTVHLMEQDPVMFNDTIAENIALGRGLTTPHENKVLLSLYFAGLVDEVEEIPERFHAVIGTDGKTLNGGQKQQVAIARARHRDPPVLIFDEATSGLDRQKKAEIMSNLRKWRKGRTTIVITHHIEDITEQDDYIVILDHGKVSEHGTYRDLKRFSLVPRMENNGGLNDPDHLPPLPRTPAHRKLSHPATKRIRTSASAAAHGVADDEIDNILNMYTDRRDFIRQSLFNPLDSGNAPEQASENLKRQSPNVFSFAIRAQDAPSTSMTNREYDVSREETLWIEIVKAWVLRFICCASGKAEVLDHENGRPPHHEFSRLREDLSHIDLQQPQEVVRAENTMSLYQILKTAWSYGSKSTRLLLIAGIVPSLIHATATPVFSMVWSRLLSTLYKPIGASHQAMISSLQLLAVAVVDGVATFCMYLLFERCAQRWVDDLRTRAFRNILEYPQAFFDNEISLVSKFSELLDRHAEDMRYILSRFANLLCIAITMMSISLVWALIKSWRLTLICLAICPYALFASQVSNRVSSRWERRINEAVTAATDIMTETLVKIQTVKILTAEDIFIERFNIAIDKLFHMGTKRTLCCAGPFGFAESVQPFGFALTFYFGALLSSGDSQLISHTISTINLLLFTLMQVSLIAAILPQFVSSRESATQLIQFATLEVKSHEHFGRDSLSDHGPIVFSNVDFRYRTDLEPSPLVLQNFTLTITPNVVNAITGPSGCGKSTLIALLLRLYPMPRPAYDLVDEFERNSWLHIGVQNIRNLNVRALRANVVGVPQRPILFPGTIAHNIKYNMPDATLDEVQKAAELAGIREEIETRFNGGFEARIGENNSGVSGGQAQRIALARAFLRKPRILVLDEPSSALDGWSARHLGRTLARLSAEWGHSVTVIAFTHDQILMAAADKLSIISSKGEQGKPGDYEDLRETNKYLQDIGFPGVHSKLTFAQM